MSDASTLNDYVAAGYMTVSYDASYPERTKELVEAYQSQFGELEGYSEKVFDLTTEEASKFILLMKEQQKGLTVAKNMSELPEEQSELLLYISANYTLYVEGVDRDDEHSLFQDFINEKLLDEATMYTRTELNYRCLPAVKK